MSAPDHCVRFLSPGTCAPAGGPRTAKVPSLRIDTAESIDTLISGPDPLNRAQTRRRAARPLARGPGNSPRGAARGVDVSLPLAPRATLLCVRCDARTNEEPKKGKKRPPPVQSLHPFHAEKNCPLKSRHFRNDKTPSENGLCENARSFRTQSSKTGSPNKRAFSEDALCGIRPSVGHSSQS